METLVDPTSNGITASDTGSRRKAEHSERLFISPTYGGQHVVQGEIVAQMKAAGVDLPAHLTLRLAGLTQFRGRPALRLDLDTAQEETEAGVGIGGTLPAHGYVLIDPDDAMVLKAVWNLPDLMIGVDLL